MAIVVQPLGYIFKIKIGEVTFYCKQLSYRMRSIIGARHHKQVSGSELQDAMGLLFEVLRHSIVKVECLINPDGSDYVLEFDNGVLTEACLDLLFHIESVGDVLQMCATNFVHMRCPDKILGPDGKPLEGVSVEKIAPNKKK